MVITIDTSALLAVLVNEEHKNQIIDLTSNCDLQAPAIIDAEVGNALSAMMKRGRLSLHEAIEVTDQFSTIPIRRTSIRLQEAMELSEGFSIYAYDSYVLDCARQFRTPLLSLDGGMIDVAKTLNIQIIEVSA